MADPNTCQQCGSVKTVRQSGKGRLVCQACYDIENPVDVVPAHSFTLVVEKDSVKPIVSSVDIWDTKILSEDKELSQYLDTQKTKFIPIVEDKRPVVSDKLFYTEEIKKEVVTFLDEQWAKELKVVDGLIKEKPKKDKLKSKAS